MATAAPFDFGIQGIRLERYPEEPYPMWVQGVGFLSRAPRPVSRATLFFDQGQFVRFRLDEDGTWTPDDAKFWCHNAEWPDAHATLDFRRDWTISEVWPDRLCITGGSPYA